jgi:translocation and assembly module TamA
MIRTSLTWLCTAALAIAGVAAAGAEPASVEPAAASAEAADEGAARVTVHASDETVRTTVEGYLSAWDGECLTTGVARRRALRAAEGRVRDALDALGYFGGEVSVTVEAPTVGEGGCPMLAAKVEPGVRARIESFTLDTGDSGQDQPFIRRALEDPTLTPGAMFDPQAYERVKSRLLDEARRAGYLDVQFERHRVVADAASGTVAIEWQLAVGEVYRFGTVDVESLVLAPSVAQSYLEFEPGDPYSIDAIIDARNHLIESDYFREVRVEGLEDERVGREVPVRVVVETRERYSLLTGAGYSTDTGPRGRLDLEARYLNALGHKGNVSAVASPVEGSVTFNYQWPWGNPRDEWYAVQPGFWYEDTDTSTSETLGLQFKRTERVTERILHVASANLTREDFEIGGTDGVSQLLLFTTYWTYSSGEGERRPLFGTRLNAYARGGAEALASDTDVFQVGMRAKQVLPLPFDSRLITRGEIGWTWQSDFDDLPPSLRFFAGGDNSVRGYGFETLGEVEDGDVIGGRKLLVGSIELDKLVRPDWSVALFVDSGSAFNDTANFSTGVGIGVRWYSPLGPIRLDLAHPLDDSRSVRVHVSLGPDL